MLHCFEHKRKTAIYLAKEGKKISIDVKNVWQKIMNQLLRT